MSATLEQQERNTPARDSYGRLRPGHSGNLNGRPKARTIPEQLADAGFNCVQEAVAMFKDPKTTNYVRWDILKELLSYQYAKPKNVTIQNPDGENASIKISWDTDAGKQQFVDTMQSVEHDIVQACTEDDAESSVK